MTEKATLGGGCFWCLEAVYKDLRGVRAVMSGYAAGHTANPSYKQVCSGATGHAEVVQIDFDPAEVSYEDLLRVFFSIHDPTTKDRQGNDVGTQYRSAIFYNAEAQRETAREVIAEIDRAGIWGGEAVTGPAVEDVRCRGGQGSGHGSERVGLAHLVNRAG